MGINKWIKIKDNKEKKGIYSFYFFIILINLK